MRPYALAYYSIWAVNVFSTKCDAGKLHAGLFNAFEKHCNAGARDKTWKTGFVQLFKKCVLDRSRSEIAKLNRFKRWKGKNGFDYLSLPLRHIHAMELGKGPPSCASQM